MWARARSAANRWLTADWRRGRGAMSGSIARALRIVRAHPNMVSVGQKTVVDGGAWSVEVTIKVGLPNPWMAVGHSPNGVRTIEPVTLIFPASFPLKAPTIWLRADFDRSLAHVQPGGLGDRPVPCIADLAPSELLHQQGLAGILNQLVLWLENAALGRLIDPAQGWEPVRRDDLAGFIVADAAALRGLVSRDAGSATFGFDYLSLADGGGERSVYGEMGASRLPLNERTIGALIAERVSSKTPAVRVGHSLAVVAWPGRLPSGGLFVSGHYQPETVTDLGSLIARAADYGCARPLQGALNWIRACLAGHCEPARFPLVVVLCARRPFHVIGSDSAIELSPYVVDIGPPTFLGVGDRTPVQPIGHRHAITPNLLRALSGAPTTDHTPSWIQVGCGSLGSKIALHLARAGRAPATVIDRSYLSPHNAARHALAPDIGGMPLHWIDAKAVAVAEAIEGLGQTATAVTQDVIGITRDRTAAKKHLPKKAWAVVNATASLGVREAFGSMPPAIEIARVLEASLFANGELGLLTVEGPDRNPDTLDLMAEAYSIMRMDDALRPVMFGAGATVTRQVTGEGCGSPTMVMSDARISMFAAPMAETVMRMQNTSLPEHGGRLLIGKVSDDGLGLSWSDHAVLRVAVVGVEGAGNWSVRISARAAETIADNIRQWPGVETGGIVMGRISEPARTFYVTDVLPAPTDSARCAHEFVLGIGGARKTIADYAESAGYSLFCLGTWHSHLSPSGPSITDRRTAAAVALARLAPSMLLIHTPAGFRALLADGAGATLPTSAED